MGRLGFLSLLLALAEVQWAAAQQAPLSVCVTDPEGKISAQTQKRLGEELRLAVERYGQLKVTRGPGLSARLLRLRARCIDEKLPCLVAMGRMARTDRLLYTRVSESESQLKVEMFLVDVPRKLLLDRYTSASAVAEDKLSEEMARALESILGPRVSGQLKVSSNVAGAEVLLDGEPVGKTPLVLTRELAPGQHRIELRQKGYLSAEQSFQVADSQGVTLHVPLEKEPAQEAKLGGGKEEEPQVADQPQGQPVPPETARKAVSEVSPLGVSSVRCPAPGEDLSTLMAPSSAAPLSPGEAPVAPAVETRPFWKSWWFWTAVGVVAAGSVTLGLTLGSGAEGIPSGKGRVIIEF